MEQNQNQPRPESATDEPASSFNPGDAPGFADPPLVSDALSDFVEGRLGETLGETFPPGARKPRHDGWGPDEIAGFLRALAATGVVEHAARQVRRSPQSAYNFRNSRRGRSFARVWDAVLVNRARARLASEVQGRAMAGCVSLRKKDGEVVSEYHYYDNRLAMSVLARLDRLAEREAPSEAHLRVLSEDYEDYIDCVEAGGDADAFVEERRPAEDASEQTAEREDDEGDDAVPDDDPELTLFAHGSGCDDYLDADPNEIEVRDLDPARTADWDSDQWVRAYRSGFMTWLEMRGGPDLFPGGGAALRYHVSRRASCAAHESGLPRSDEDADMSDLDPEAILGWTDDQLARGWTCRIIQRLTDEHWDRLAEREEE